MRRHDVAIYVASAGTAGHYDRARGRAGGAERQMTLLARSLAERGRSVAHITFAPKEPVELPPRLTLVLRDGYRGGPLGPVHEARAIWRALSRADADVVVVRSASPALGVAALHCRLRRRRLVFSSSNVSDFTLERMPGRLDRALYRLGVRLADVVVVQSRDQVSLAPRAAARRLVRIPSFAETDAAAGASPAPPEAFLWFGRAVPQKGPLSYVDLARSLPEARFVMIPVPDGPDPALLEVVRARAREVPNLELLDPLPHSELQVLVASSVAVVNTSSLEGMPNAFLEAWARGVPVLTLEFDPDGVVAREGLGVSAEGSWAGLVAGARALWEGRADRAELSARVRAYVEREHSAEAVASRWDALVDELVRGALHPETPPESPEPPAELHEAGDAALARRGSEAP